MPTDYNTDVRIGLRHKSLHNDIEDDLDIAAALRADVDYLVTNDERLIRHSPVPTLSSADLLTLLDAERR